VSKNPRDPAAETCSPDRRLKEFLGLLLVQLPKSAIPSCPLQNGCHVREDLSKEVLAAILAQPDLQRSEARRDAVLLCVLYDTGARVQELADLSVGDVRLDRPAQIRLLGKGRKMRAVPLMGNTVQLLRRHMQENQLDHPKQFDKPLFHNARHERLTRSGIRYILHKYVVVMARTKCPSLNRTVSPHTLRHTKGIHLLQSGISLDKIRDFLGHVDAKTTQIYARANLEMKRNALEKSVSLRPSRGSHTGSRTRAFLTGSIPCNPSQGHACMATDPSCANQPRILC
jgi:site-specific recombinase XerD